MIDFEIKILRQHWIQDNGSDDKHDLCSHGEVFIRVGSEELSNRESGSWSLSTAGLFLLRSLEQDCNFGEFENQLIPCCGHSIYPNEDKKDFALIMGCGDGVDWKINHLKDRVAFETATGTKAELLFEEYRKMVLEFTDEIEEFYGNPNNKVLPDDEFEKDGFNQFWTEWREKKDKWRKSHKT
jgi:hypothetical protein